MRWAPCPVLEGFAWISRNFHLFYVYRMLQSFAGMPLDFLDDLHAVLGSVEDIESSFGCY